MSSKKLALFLGLSLLLVAAVITAAQPAAAQASPNLLTNPGFEGGHYNQDGIAEITVPNGWRMHWLDGVTFSDAYNGIVARRPETVVWNATGGVPAGEEVFWRDGIYTLKIFKSWAPLYAAVSQDVSGLQVGRRYQLVAPVYTDIYDWEGRKVPPTDATHGQVRLGASPVGAGWRDEAAIAYSGWFAASYADYGIFSYEFTATQADMTVWIEVKGTYPHSNNGFFIDTVGLYALDAVAPVTDPGSGSTAPAPAPVGPTPTPLPPPTPRADGAVVHVVQTGDTMWGIAIRYAGAMGLSAEDALPAIQALNNNPAFLTVGQELLIIEGTAAAASPSEAVTAEEAVAETGETVETDAAAAGGTPVEGEVTPTPEPEPIAAVPEETGATLCVSAFNDDNGDGLLNDGAESLLADAALTISRASETVVTTVTDGLQPEHCFGELEPDTYQVQFFPPADYTASTDNSWAVALSDGMQVSVSFGAQFNPAAEEVVAAAVDEAGAGGEETAVSPETPAENAAPEEQTPEAGSRIGTIIIGVAVFLVVLAAIGVVLLRRA